MLCCSMYFCVVLCIFVLFYVYFVLFYYFCVVLSIFCVVLLFLCCSMYFCVVLCIVCFVSFCVLFMCICVLYYTHRVATQLQLNISYHIYSLAFQIFFYSWATNKTPSSRSCIGHHQLFLLCHLVAHITEQHRFLPNIHLFRNYTNGFSLRYPSVL